jgi:hypothetical protein
MEILLFDLKNGLDGFFLLGDPGTGAKERTQPVEVSTKGDFQILRTRNCFWRDNFAETTDRQGSTGPQTAFCLETRGTKVSSGAVFLATILNFEPA